jgi:hypothetical protein
VSFAGDLPSGWTYRDVDGDGAVLLITHPTGGMVTLDFERRGFRTGYSTTGSVASTGTYKGREWRLRLVADAVAYLKNIYGEP